MAPYPYAFSSKRPVRREFVRVLKRISGRLTRVARQRGETVEAIHEIRTLIKLLRALLWLGKPAFPPTTSAYAKIELKNAARLFAALRDVTVTQSTLKELAEEAQTPEQRSAIKIATDLLHVPAPRKRLGDRVSPRKGQAVALVQKAIRLLIHGATTDIPWKSKRLEKAQAHMELARETAERDPTAVHLHEWRKKAKRFFYLLQILEPKPKKKAKRRIERIDKLQQKLGDHHDSVALEERLVRTHPVVSAKPEIQALFELIEARKQRLRKKAEKTARKIPSI